MEPVTYHESWFKMYVSFYIKVLDIEMKMELIFIVWFDEL